MATNENTYGEIKVEKMNHEFRMGYDCAINGATTINSHYSLFSTPAKTKTWEAGKKYGELKKAEWDQEKSKSMMEKNSTENIRTCRKCGCSDNDACYHPKRGACWWVSKDLCSHCAYWPGESTRL